jgi:hypothetical protein
VVKSKLKAVEYSWGLGWGERERPLCSERGELETTEMVGENVLENPLGSGWEENEAS